MRCFQRVSFWLISVVFLGHVVSKEGIRADPKNILVVRYCDKPILFIKNQIFIGLVGYYQ